LGRPKPFGKRCTAISFDRNKPSLVFQLFSRAPQWKGSLGDVSPRTVALDAEHEYVQGTSNNDDFSSDRSPARRDDDFDSQFVVSKLCFVGQAPRLGRAGHTTPSCGSHPLQRHQPADVVGKVLQSDFGFRPRDADRPHDPATRRVLLSTEHVLDAGSNSALLAVRVLLCLR